VTDILGHAPSDAIDDAFEEFSSFTVAVQVFAHAEEKVEPVLR
jgi:hypothetical protein